jgi:hypothetical protein
MCTYPAEAGQVVLAMRAMCLNLTSDYAEGGLCVQALPRFTIAKGNRCVLVSRQFRCCE